MNSLVTYALKYCVYEYLQQDSLYSFDYEADREEWKHHAKKHNFKQAKWSANRPRSRRK